MQLKKQKNVRTVLALATCTLLASPSHAAIAEDWDFDSAFLVYSEKDRVNIIEPVISGKKVIDEEQSIRLRLVADSMTGASPNGAVASSKPQTFTSPSGKENYTTEPNQMPLQNFRDNRFAASLEWETALSRTLRGFLGSNVSAENDYMSLGLSASVNWDLNQKLTSLSTGFALNADQVKPLNGIPEGLALMSTSRSEDNLRDDDDEDNDDDDEEEEGRPGKSKMLSDVILGLTQVINRRTLMQVNYGIGQTNGYLTDPYKILSVVNGSSGETVAYRYEHRPDTRNHQFLYWKTIYHLPQDVVHLSYRYYWDDWGILSHTVDLKYRFDIGSKIYLQPNIRYYQQSAADFYRHSLVQDNTPDFASADYRLAAMYSYTFGLKYAQKIKSNQELSFRVEYLKQNGESHPANAIGVQRDQNLYPGLEALFFQIGFSIEL